MFAFDRREWTVLLALTLRFAELIGAGVRLPRRVRSASVAAGHPLHVTNRLSLSLDVGLSRILRLEATQPVPELVERLNSFHPEWLHAYPSIAALLAEEQEAGRLRIAPRVVSTSSELRTEQMTERIRAAWGHAPFDCYGVTEVGLFGAECEQHRGIHAFDDLFIFEVVDDDYRAVPEGETGTRIPITNLFARTQPLVRYEVTDMISVEPEPCPCGRPFPLLRTVAGRSDDILPLPDSQGGMSPCIRCISGARWRQQRTSASTRSCSGDAL